VVHSPFLLAQAAGGNPLTTFGFMAALFAIMYFLLIRPQQKQAKEHRQLVASLKKGDEVVTQGGMLGKIYAVSDKLVTLEIANGVRVRILKTSVQGRGQLTEDVVSGTVKADEKKEEK
jgi:preprotein translocase subunit YajC